MNKFFIKNFSSLFNFYLSFSLFCNTSIIALDPPLTDLTIPKQRHKKITNEGIE